MTYTAFNQTLSMHDTLPAYVGDLSIKDLTANISIHFLHLCGTNRLQVLSLWLLHRCLILRKNIVFDCPLWAIWIEFWACRCLNWVLVSDRVFSIMNRSLLFCYQCQQIVGLRSWFYILTHWHYPHDSICLAELIKDVLQIPIVRMWDSWCLSSIQRGASSSTYFCWVQFSHPVGWIAHFWNSEVHSEPRSHARLLLLHLSELTIKVSIRLATHLRLSPWIKHSLKMVSDLNRLVWNRGLCRCFSSLWSVSLSAVVLPATVIGEAYTSLQVV